MLTYIYIVITYIQEAAKYLVVIKKMKLKVEVKILSPSDLCNIIITKNSKKIFDEEICYKSMWDVIYSLACLLEFKHDDITFTLITKDE